MDTENNEKDAPLLDCDTYRKIKKMDKETLQGLIQDIYPRYPRHRRKAHRSGNANH